MGNSLVFLQRVSIFSGIGQDSLERIASITQEKTYPKKSIIFHEGDRGDTLYILKSGRVKISKITEDGREKTLALMQPGEFFGEMAIFDEQPRSATAEVLDEQAVVFTLAKRDFEREIIPMCAAEGMGLCPWGSIGGGAFKTTAQREELAKSGNPGRQVEPRDVDVAVSKVLENVADRHNTAVTSVALAYVMSKAPHVFPIVGGRKVEHLLGNIEALGLELSEEDIKEIEGAYEFDPGFPTTFLFRGENTEAHPGNVTFKNAAARFDYVDLVRPIKPKSLDA